MATFRTRPFWLATTLSMILLTGCTPSPEPSGSTSPPTTSPPPATEALVYFVADTPMGMNLFTELRSFTDDSPEAVVADLVDGTLQPLDPDFTNLWGNGNSLNSLTGEAGAYTVDLHYAGLNVGSAAEMLAIMQVVWTLESVDPDTESVLFLVDGKPVETLAGHVDTTAPFLPGEAYEWVNPLTIDFPNQGDVVTAPVVARGMACTFEAAVAWELWLAGDKVDSGSVIAGEACPVRSAWQVDLGELEPGEYTFRVMDYSAKDGSLLSDDDRDFTVE